MNYSLQGTPETAHHLGFSYTAPYTGSYAASYAGSYSGYAPVNNDWLHSNHQSSSNYSQQPPLQEPGSFEDFQFSFGLDPNFAIPVPLDIPSRLPEDGQWPVDDTFQFNFTIPSQNISQLRDASNSNSLLNEDDQKAFSQFLDTFFPDTSAATEPLANTIPAGTEPAPYTAQLAPEGDDDEERRTSILRSLDERKRLPQRMTDLLGNTREGSYYMTADHSQTGPSPSSQVMPHQPDLPSSASFRTDAIYLHKSNAVTPPFIRPRQPSNHRLDKKYIKRPSADGGSMPPMAWRRTKGHKELLTLEEKRANHIASEQKRRSTIRNGFKELTDIIPTLKNINNSKSTVLFKAIDYIKYLEKRNKGLRDKVAALEVRLEVENRLKDGSEQPSQQFQRNNREADLLNSTNDMNQADSVAARAAAALRVHKAQQSNLLELQGQLQLHQKMVADGGKMSYSRPTRADDPMEYYGPYDMLSQRPVAKGFRPIRHDDNGLGMIYSSTRQGTKSMDVDATEEPLKTTVSA